MIDRIPPQSLESEQVVLGSILIDATRYEQAASIISPSDFYRDAHRVIFEACAALLNQGEPIDLRTVQNKLIEWDKLEECGGLPYLAICQDAVTTVVYVEHFARTVRDRALRRKIIDSSDRLIEIAHDYESDQDVTERAERAVLDATATAHNGRLTPIRESAEQVFDTLESRQENPGKMDGLRTGITGLDFAIGGLRPGELTILGARPSMGKSSLALAVALHAARHEEASVAFFSMEMPEHMLCERLTALDARVEYSRMRSAMLNQEEWNRIGLSMAKLYDTPIYIDDECELTSMAMRSRLRRLRGVGLVVVDYLQLMQTQKAENRNQEVTALSRDLKNVARHFNVPVLALSQLSRSVESRANKRPMLSDLRDSGALEQDADSVLFLYRHDYYNPPAKPNPVERAEVIVAKSRNGATGVVPVAFVPPIMRFDNLAQEHDTTSV